MDTQLGWVIRRLRVQCYNMDSHDGHTQHLVGLLVGPDLDLGTRTRAMRHDHRYVSWHAPLRVVVTLG